MKLHAQRGMVLAVSLMLLLLMTLAVASGVRISLLEMRLAANDELHATATEQAQALLERSLATVREPLPWGVMQCLEQDDALLPGCSTSEPLPMAEPHPIGGTANAQLEHLMAPEGPPPVGSGYSADRFRSVRMRVAGVYDRRSDGLGRALARQDLALLQPRAWPRSAPERYTYRFEAAGCSEDGAPIRRRTLERWIAEPDGSASGPFDLGEHTGSYREDATSQPVVLRYLGPGAAVTRVVASSNSDGQLALLEDTGPGVGTLWTWTADETLTTRQSAAADRNSLEGVISVLHEDTNRNSVVEPGEKVLLFYGLRRGGRAYYAFNISDPRTPDLIWKISDVGRQLAGMGIPEHPTFFSDLGFAWSTPRVVQRAGNRAALVFGGGHDGIAATSTIDSTIGNALFIIDAESGEPLWKATGGSETGPSHDPTVYMHQHLRDAVVSRVALLDANADGLHDRVIFGDTGGNLWRAELSGTPSSWSLLRLACLGRHGTAGCGDSSAEEHNRRFLAAPDIVQHGGGGLRYDAVVIASGDPEQPATAGNRIFMIKDPNVVPGTAQDLDLTLADLSDVTECEGHCDVGEHGWTLRLPPVERTAAKPQAFAGSIVMASNAPDSSGGCDDGAATLHALNIADGSATNHLGGPRSMPLDTAVRRNPVILSATIPGCRLTLLAGRSTKVVAGCSLFRTSWRISH